jgi:Flp pilus assembly protein TadG
MSIGARIRGMAARFAASEISKRAAGFRRSTRANVAMIFGLSLVPLTIAAGTGLDLARSMLVHSQMISALDAAALAVGSTKGLNQQQMQTLAQQYFNANFTADPSFGTPKPVVVSEVNQTVVVSCSDPMPTVLMSVVGIKKINVLASSLVVWGQERLWISLVLDNTGSMTQTSGGSNPVSKISALKTASHQLLTMLQGIVVNPGDVQVAIIPFARDVKVGTAKATQTWLDWSDWSKSTTKPSKSIGPGSTCPYTDASNTFHCQVNPTNGSSSTTTIPSSGTYKGYICPSADTHGHYYNGCWNTTGTSGNYAHTWIVNNTNTWTGCVTDRAQDYDTQNTTPVVGNIPTMMVAENSPSCVQATLMGMSSDFSALSTEIDSMVAAGSTNQTIGLVWGWQAQSQGVPLSAPALPDHTGQIMILLSDGLNTQDRWYGDGSNQSSQVDSRMALACTNAKAVGFTIYAVYVDLNGTQGNSTVLQNCASDPTKYFDLTSAQQIITTFNAIGVQITNLRING